MRDYCYSPRFEFINTYDIRYNCRSSNILHKHINPPIASGTRYVTIFEPVCSRSLRPIEKRVRAASRTETAVFIVIIFSCLFLARISNRKSAPSSAVKTLAFALSPSTSFPPVCAVHCSRAILAWYTWPGKAIIYKYSNVIFHLRSVSLIRRVRDRYPRPCRQMEKRCSLLRTIVGMKHFFYFCI